MSNISRAKVHERSTMAINPLKVQRLFKRPYTNIIENVGCAAGWGPRAVLRYVPNSAGGDNML